MIYYVSKSKQLFQSPNIQEAGIEDVHNWLKTNNIIGFDTETTGFSAIKDGLLCYQFGNRDTQFVIESGSFPIELFSIYFQDSNKLFILQNFKFDGRFLLKHKIDIWKMNVYDTFLAECVLTTGLDTRGLGLDDIVWKYCNVKLDKTIRGEINRIGLSSKVIKYAADDVVYLEDVMNKQIELLQQHSLMNVMKLENEVVKVFTLMEFHGVKLDVSKWNEVIVTVNAESLQLENSLNDIVLADNKFKDFRPRFTQLSMFDYVQAKTDINWSSNQQKLAVCQKIEPLMVSVGDRELQRIKAKHPIVKTLISYNKYKKLQSSFGKKFLDFVDVDSRIRASIWQILKH